MRIFIVGLTGAAIIGTSGKPRLQEKIGPQAVIRILGGLAQDRKSADRVISISNQSGIYAEISNSLASIPDESGQVRPIVGTSPLADTPQSRFEQYPHIVADTRPQITLGELRLESFEVIDLQVPNSLVRKTFYFIPMVDRTEETYDSSVAEPIRLAMTFENIKDLICETKVWFVDTNVDSFDLTDVWTIQFGADAVAGRAANTQQASRASRFDSGTPVAEISGEVDSSIATNDLRSAYSFIAIKFSRPITVESDDLDQALYLRGRNGGQPVEVAWKMGPDRLAVFGAFAYAFDDLELVVTERIHPGDAPDLSGLNLNIDAIHSIPVVLEESQTASQSDSESSR